MQIGGFEPFSLCDYPGKPSAVVFTQGCNFRCPYCHNSQLIRRQNNLKGDSSLAVMEFLERRQGQLEGVVISGGEPCLQSELIPFLKSIKRLGFAVKLDTNGSYPETLEELFESKLLDFIAMDIKAPVAHYTRLAGTSVDTTRILESIEIIRESGCAYQFRTTWDKRFLSKEDLDDIRNLLPEESDYNVQECVLKL